MQIKRGVSRVPQFNYSVPVDYGYVIVPYKQDRDKYVTTCLRRERVTIVGESGSGMIKDCYITRAALREVDFPTTDKELGSMVTYISNPFNNKPMIVGVVSKESESQMLEEGELRLEKIWKSNKISISGKSKTGDLFIDVEGNEDIGSLFINVSGKNDGSQLKINVNGDATIYSDDTLNLETVGEVNIKSIDQSDETKFSSIKVVNSNINITPSEDGTFTVSNGEEPILLGNKTVAELEKDRDRMSELQTAINGWTPVPNDGGAALKLALTAWLSQVMANYSEVKSEISFTD